MANEPKPDMPEWLRVVAIFVLTFALVMVLGGLAGIKVNRADEPPLSPEAYNRP